MKKVIIGAILTLCTLCLSVSGSWISNAQFTRIHKIYEGICIVLDAGHGGKDAGAQFDGVYESEINLEIVKLLKKELEELGMEVILTRQDENDLSDAQVKNKKSDDLKKRVAIINDEKVDLFISVHMNAYVDTSVKGMQLFYEEGNSDSLLFANHLQNHIENIITVLPIKMGDYYILNKSNKIGVLLECGFLSNREDRENFKSKIYRKQYVKYIKKGIMSFLQEVYE